MSPLYQVTENVEWVEVCMHLLREAVGKWFLPVPVGD